MNDVVLRIVVRLLLPMILMYALYIQLHGEYSPGGGFQAGVIFAAGFIVYSLVHDLDSVKKIIPPLFVRITAALGIFLYAGIGVLTMGMGGKFLDYSALHSDKLSGQNIGIMLVELGVGLTVFAVIMLIFYSFGERSNNDA